MSSLKKVNQTEIKIQNRALDYTWLTKKNISIKNTFSIKNKLLTKFIKLKEPTLKNEAHTKYKLYRTMLARLLKRSKHTYFSSFFQNYINHLKILGKV